MRINIETIANNSALLNVFSDAERDGIAAAGVRFARAKGAAARAAAWEAFSGAVRAASVRVLGSNGQPVDMDRLRRREIDELMLLDAGRQKMQVSGELAAFEQVATRRARAARAEAERQREGDPARRSFFPIVDYTAEGTA